MSDEIKMCPLRNAHCYQKGCGWWLVFEEACAMKYLGLAATAYLNQGDGE